MDEHDERQKVVIVGDGYCGKTCMVLRYTRNEFPDDYVPTVCEATATSVQVDEYQRRAMVVLWDTAGQEDYDRLRPLCYKRTNVVVVCFAVNSPDSFDNVQLKWMPEVRHYCPDAPVVLVATKTDLRRGRSDARRSITTDDGKELARQLRADAYAECSSKTGDGVADVFQTAAREALRVGRQFNSSRRRSRCDLL